MKIFLALLLILFGVEIDRVIAQSRPRFEKIYTQNTGSQRDTSFTIFHDKETGNEIVCAYKDVDLGYSISCFQTGRNWP